MSHARRTWLLVAALAAPASGVFLAAAQTTSEKLEQLQQQLERQKQLSEQQRRKLEELRRDLAQLGQQQRDTLARLDTLAEQIAELERQGQDVQTRIQSVQLQIKNLEGQIAVTSARVERLKEDVRHLMRAVYREKNARYLQLVSQAKSLSDLVIRARYANAVGEQNVRIVRELRTQVEALEAQKQQQLTLNGELTQLQQQLQAKLKAVQSRRSQQQTLLAELQRSEQGQRALALQTQAQVQVTARSIDSILGGIVQERARVEAERRAREEAERRRREEEARRLREEQARLQRERERLARLEQERRAAAARAAAAREAAARVAARAAAAREAAAREAAAREAAAREAAAREAARQRERLEREQQAVASRQQQLQQQEQQAQQQSAPLPDSVGQLSVPLAGGRVTKPFGAEGPWTVLTGEPGAAVTAAAEGEVIGATPNPNLGWIVFIQHTPTLLTVYSGIASPAVGIGARVGRGQLLGYAGGSPLFGADSISFQVVRVGAGGSRQYHAPNF